MTDGQSLLLLFAALYFIECLRWLPPRSYLLIGSGVSWAGRSAFQAVELRGGCPGLLGLLPPLQTHLVTLPWQWIPAEAGLELHVDARPPIVVPWQDIRPFIDGYVLHLGRTFRVRCLSDRHAGEALAQVERWLPLTQAEREADFLRHAAQTLKTDPLLAAAQTVSPRTRPLRFLGSIVFLWTFLVMAALYRWLGDGFVILGAAAGLFLFQFIQAVLFYRSATGLPYRFWKSLAAAVLPQHAMRAADPLADTTKHSPFHPLAARKLLGEEAWRKLALSFWKQARYQPSATAALQIQALASFFETQDIVAADLETAPERQGDSVTYCPRCQVQFQAGATVCKDCGGVELRPF